MIDTAADQIRRAAAPNPERLVPMLRRALESPRPSADEWDQLLRRLGVTCRPVGAEALQRALVAAGHDAAGNEFSQDLIARREE